MCVQEPSRQALTIAPLTAESGPSFSSLTYRRLAIHAAHPSHPWVAMGASVEGHPVGLALGHAPPGRQGTLLSLFVEPIVRRQGIGESLAAAVAARMAHYGIERVTLGLCSDNPARVAIDRILINFGEQPLHSVSIRITGLAGRMAQAGRQWLGVSRLIERTTIAFDHWDSLTASDCGVIDALAARVGFAKPAGDILRPKDLEPAVCVVVRRQGIPVGWVTGVTQSSPLAERSATSAVFYMSACVEPELARSAIMIAAFWHAFTRQATRFGADSIASYHTQTPSMIALSRRRFAPIALKAEEVMQGILKTDVHRAGR